MPLQYLTFDTSDDGADTGTWDAMASVRADQIAGVLAEAQWVVEQAEINSPGPRGPLDEGGVWDVDQQVLTEGEWITVTLTITGPWEWGEALMEKLAMIV